MAALLSALLRVARAALVPRAALALENAALRQQLTIYQRTQRRTRLRAGDRIFWVILRRLWPGWDRALIVVSPDPVAYEAGLGEKSGGAAHRIAAAERRLMLRQVRQCGAQVVDWRVDQPLEAAIREALAGQPAATMIRGIEL